MTDAVNLSRGCYYCGRDNPTHSEDCPEQYPPGLQRDNAIGEWDLGFHHWCKGIEPPPNTSDWYALGYRCAQAKRIGMLGQK
ncbi:MAG TPA: hypothetical protein VLE72_04005 [Candidatus Saccharimonadales bacterium]|nr:hypothetical protein [Candidatus Saccharimonadales bacterium]